MSGLPTVTVIGTLTADVELRFVGSGAAVATFTVAANERKFDKNSNTWTDGAATFLRCSVWRQAAENLVESVSRGDRVIVTGQLKQREYEKDGQKRTAYELDVDEVGPSVKWAVAKTQKVGRGSESGRGGGAPTTDPWASSLDSAEAPF